MKIFAFGWLGVLLIGTLPALAQDSNLDRLLQERDKLYTDYEFYEKQNSSLFGKKSKKDLLNMIGTLRGIIDKDSELIREVRLQGSQLRMQTSRRESGFVDQNRQVADRLAGLNGDVDKLTAQVKLKESELLTQQDFHRSLQNNFYVVTALATLFGFTTLGLAMYVRRLKRRSALSGQR